MPPLNQLKVIQHMGESQTEDTSTQALNRKALFTHIAHGVLRYVVLSVFIGLFFENTLFWMFLATAGVTAWTMWRIAMHGRAQLPGKLWRKWKRYEKENRTFDLKNAQEQKEWQQIEAYKIEKYNERPFVFRKTAWFALLVPVIGSVLLQLLYFTGLGTSIDAGLLITWILSNLFLTVTFSCIGGFLMFLFLWHKQKKETTHHTQNKKKRDSRWIDRLISSVVLVFYLSAFVVPTITPLSAASPDCSKTKVTPEEFISCYDPDTEYQSHSEAIVPEPKRRIPLGSGTAGSGNKVSSLKEYYSKHRGIPPEQINELYDMCQKTAGCNFEELLTEYENEVLTLPVYENETPDDPNLLLATLEGLGGVGQDTWNLITKEGRKGLNYLKDNWNNPKKMLDDAGNTIGKFRQAYEEGQRDRLGQKGNDAKGLADWFGKKAQQYWHDPSGQLKKDLGWMDKNILQPYLKHGADVHAYLQKNPKEAWMMTNMLTAPYFHGKVFIESNYNGGIKQFKQDAAVALADKNTYWNILKSPFSERTQQLAAEGKLAQAMGRGAGEMSIEAGQELAETVATAGVGKIGLVVANFTVDASKVAGRTVKIADTVGDYTKIPKSMLKTIKYSNASYNVKADTSRFAEYALQHLFDGNVNKKNKVGGFHHAGENSAGKVTRVIRENEKTGVYEAEVEVFGHRKNSNLGRSTMFPRNWSRENVVTAVNEAYGVKKPVPGKGNLYRGTSSTGIQIEMRIDSSGKIETAYPVL
jgi:hypothetical protein